MTSVTSLVRKRLRLEPASWLLQLATACTALGCGFAIGRGLAAGTSPSSALAQGNSLFVAVVALTAALPLGAVAALYHDDLHLVLLPLPVSGRKHFALGLRLFVRGKLPWLLLALGVGAGCSPSQPLWPVIFAAVVYAGAALFAIGFAGMSAGLAASRAPGIVALRRSLAGPFSSDHHAPFFYLPALAFLSTAISAAAAEAGLVLATASNGVGPVALGLLAVPIAAGLACAILGGWIYRRSCLRVIPRVAEEARSVYAGKPVPAEPPYGLGLAQLLPRGLRPYYAKELRELVRANRALWALTALGSLLCLAYAVNAGDPSDAAPLIGLLLVVWAGTRALRPAPGIRGDAMQLSLPVSPARSWLGRTLALLFVAGHLGVGCGAALAFRNGATHAWVIGLALVASVSLTAAFTQIRRRERRALRWAPTYSSRRH